MTGRGLERFSEAIARIAFNIKKNNFPCQLEDFYQQQSTLYISFNLTTHRSHSYAK